MPDPKTIDVYNARATDYAALVARGTASSQLERFVGALPPGARALDLGCGPGNSARLMAQAGIAVDATDASPEMVALANAHAGVSARIAVFEDLEAKAHYHGIWANFSLLHAPREHMQGHLGRIHRALRTGGWLSIGLKLGTGARRDTLGRFYTYYTDAEISGLLEEAGFVVLERDFGTEKGLDGVLAPWIVLLAQRAP